MKRQVAFRMLLAMMLLAGMMLPGAAMAAGAVKVQGSASAVGMLADYYDTGEVFRYDYTVSVSSSKQTASSVTLKKYLIEDDFVAVTPTLVSEVTYEVASVTRIDRQTLEFNAPGLVAPGDGEYYGTGVWRVTTANKSKTLSWYCDACGTFHDMGQLARK